MTNDDKAEIIEIINLYAFALDTHQWDLFDRVFTEDVVAVFEPGASTLEAGYQAAPPFEPLPVDIVFEKHVAVTLRDGVVSRRWQSYECTTR